MKKLLLVSLTALTFSLMAAPASAKEILVTDRVLARNIIEITPFNLVTNAYQGSYTEQGIPSYGALITALDQGKVSAEDLVRKAISKGRLAPETIENRGYLNSVDRLLYRLKTK